MNIAILGFESQGLAAYQYWNKPDNTITICDRNNDVKVPAGIATQLGADYLQNLDRFDVLVRTPGLHPRDITAANTDAPDILSKVTAVTNEFMAVCPTKNIIGVTGTKGKGTTSTLIAKILEAAGKTVHLGGNIGTPPLDLLGNNIQPDDWVVLELANFQLIDLKYSPIIAVCLMVVPEHLNWHENMAEYVTAKQQLFVWQTFDDIAIFFHDDEYSKTVAAAGNGAKVPYFASPGAVVENGSINIGGQEICGTDELKLLGEHNWQNVCAAVTASWQVTHRIAAVHSVLTTFSGLPHRLELVREVDGVRYYDDSFGTTPETAIVAIKAFKEPKVVIIGGSDKGADYGELARAVKTGNVKRALLIGEQANKIGTALEAAGFTDFAPGGSTVAEIVKNAQRAAESGDVVLLSTGCASFDMFRNYKDRGEQFSQAVQALA